MAYKKWVLNFNGTEHLVELEHGFWSGKRKICVDGERLLATGRRFFDIGSDDEFELDKHFCTVHIRTNGMGFSYDLSVDGVSITAENRNTGTGVNESILDRMILIGSVGFLAILILMLLSGKDKVPVSVIPAPLQDLATICLSSFVAIGVMGIFIKVLNHLIRNERLKNVGWWVAGLMLISQLLISVVFWPTNGNEYVGMIQAILHYGLSPWIIAFPVIVILSCIVLGKSPTGTYLILAPVSFVLLLLSISFVDPTTLNLQVYGLETGHMINFLPVLAFVYTVDMVVMANHEEQNISIQAWAAKLVYMGWYTHILGLHEFAKRNHLEIAGPGGKAKLAVFVNGIYEGREVGAISNNQGFLLKIDSCGNDLYPIDVMVSHRQKYKEDKRTRKFTVVDGRGRSHKLYIHIMEKVRDDDISALVNAIQTEPGFLKNHSRFWTEDQTVCFYRSKLFTMKETCEDIESLCRWMIKMADLMEQKGFVRQSEQ